MRAFLLFLFFLPLFLQATPDHAFSEDEDLTLCHHVNVISGHLNLCFQDAVVGGAVPLSIVRTYSSAGASEGDYQLEQLCDNWLIQGGWSLLPHMYLLLTPGKIKDKYFYLFEKNGTMITYVFDHYEGQYYKERVAVFKPKIAFGQCSGSLSARTNPKNNRLHYSHYKQRATLYLPDGSSRIYEGKFHKDFSGIPLKEEIAPNQHRITYEHNKHNDQVTISTTNSTRRKTFSSMELKMLKKPEAKHRFHYRATTSDGKELHYRSVVHKHRHYLNDVKGNCRPNEDVHFVPSGSKARIEYLVLDDQLQFKVSYYAQEEKKKDSCDKVKTLLGPMGENGESIPIAQFSYSPEQTDVRDVENILTRYRHDGNKLLEIHYFDRSDTLDSLLRFTWDESLLKAKTYLKTATEALFSKTFHYDALGNVTEEVVWGNLTGNAPHSFSLDINGHLIGAESYKKRFAYLPIFNVPTLEEEEAGLTYKYSYKPDTNLLITKLTCEKEKILIRQFFAYNEDHLLVQEITDDGTSDNPHDLTHVTERHIKRYVLDTASGLATSCTESYFDMHAQQEHTLKRIDYTYSPQKRVIAERVHDANGAYRYTIHTEYDSRGHITLKTTPVGQRNTYTYDAFSNLVESKEVGASKKIYTYHPSGNPLSCEENGRMLYTTYDAKGRLLASTDTKGNTTAQTYDAFGRCLSTQFPQVTSPTGAPTYPTIHFTYDAQGNLATTTSPRNETTHTVYNALKKPIRIHSPDGSIVHHTYYINGTLAKTTYPDQTEVHYTYDSFQRMTSKRSFSRDGELLAEELWTFNAFHLLSHTDENGLTTTYTYDGAGRKIAEYAEDRAHHFSYDALGFLERTTDGNLTHIEIHDEAGRITEKYTEDLDGRIENHMQFFYDEENRKIKATRVTSQGLATDYFAYDPQGHLCRHQDPLGNITQFIYSEEALNDLGQYVTQKITIDPLGNQKIETFDALDRVASIEKRDPSDKTVAFEELFYDGSGNCTRKVSTIYENTTPIKTIATTWEHDCHGRVLKENESGQKITTYSYDLRGNLVTKNLPSGIQFHYTYDAIGRTTKAFSSDGTIHYEYSYETGKEPTSIIDHIHHLQWERTYNHFGQILEEHAPYNINYTWEYDTLGRCTKFTLPDHSSITYEHSGAHLSAVQRASPQNQILYEHRYTAFDPNGHVHEEELICSIGKVTTKHDLLERPSSQHSPYMQHNATYGPSSLVTAIQNSLTGNKHYHYDALDQLIQETGHHYPLNSLGNPTNAIVNECNQILSTADCTLAYDPDGNPITKTLPQDTLQYTYDALGRLRSIKSSHKAITYLYDPSSRLLSKKVTTPHEETQQLYLYDKESEIGTLSPSGTIQELKVLGLGIKGDIGAAIALELQGTAFAPLHDFGGNIVAIITPTRIIAESYHTNAYGKETLDFTPANPWRFCSKRSEEGLVYFGKRFYDPSLSRWLTPDPAGFTEGPNLYLYVLNNPLNRLDLFGLESDELLSPWRYENDCRVMVHLENIVNSRPRELFVCEGTIGGVKVDWVVSCGHFHKLQYTPEEQNTGMVNIIDHFHELMPKEGLIVGLVTGQNGMQNSLRDFQDMSQSIIDKMPESTLYIGLYNPCSWIGIDIIRVLKEFIGIETPTVARTRQFMEVIVRQLHNINHQLLWKHVSHSEGGLIGRNAIKTMNPDAKNLLKEHLISHSFGPAHSIPKTYVFDAVNIYSKKDYLTKWCATPFLKDPEYDIKFEKCTSTRSQMNCCFIDHTFLGNTYQDSLDRLFGDTRRNYGFYNVQNR